MSPVVGEEAIFSALWRGLTGEVRPPAVEIHGEPGGLPSVYSVAAFATACVATATAAVAETWASRTGEAKRPRVDRRHAAIAFRSERYLAGIGHALPPVWDPLAGDYQAHDGFVRLHTNYAYHRDAALRALDVPASRDAIAAKVRGMAGEEVERLVVEQGGCAAKMRTFAEWSSQPQGAVAKEPLASVVVREAKASPLARDASRPLSGVRVLDLTRVIAGPVCTRVLSAYGAEVLRIDPPGFEEVALLLGETTSGKRRAFLDLKSDAGRKTFERLVREADAIVIGTRGGAMDRLEIGPDRLAAWNPSLAIVCLDAYGWTGPWATRRGFDSLVQMSAGIAARGREVMASDKPFPLPAQALDHGTGYLLAAATCRALTSRARDGHAHTAKLSLARTASSLISFGDDGDPRAPDLPDDAALPYCEEIASPLGRLRRVTCPGSIAGTRAGWTIPPGALGVDRPEFSALSA